MNDILVVIVMGECRTNSSILMIDINTPPITEDCHKPLLQKNSAHSCRRAHRWPAYRRRAVKNCQLVRQLLAAGRHQRRHVRRRASPVGKSAATLPRAAASPALLSTTPTCLSSPTPRIRSLLQISRRYGQ